MLNTLHFAISFKNTDYSSESQSQTEHKGKFPHQNMRNTTKALFVKHLIPSHFLTFDHTIHFILFFLKKKYQIIHFLYHIIYYSNKKITTNQNFPLFNTTFLFFHVNHLFIFIF